jgi:hypothetical protein
MGPLKRDVVKSRSIGDNCNVGSEMLSRDMVICAGEDANEVLDAASSVLRKSPDRSYVYRCYRFWKWEAMPITVIWTGIGTGCIEPLLVEVLRAEPDISRLLLVGTAGRIRVVDGEAAELAFAIRQAYMGPTAFSAMGVFGPFEPTLYVDAPAATIVSTDLYYLFDGCRVGEWPNSHQCRDAWEEATLVDMEVAQFLYLCDVLRGGNLKYAAIKGPANCFGVHGEQTKNSRRVIVRCMELAVETIRRGSDMALADLEPRAAP